MFVVTAALALTACGGSDPADADPCDSAREAAQVVADGNDVETPEEIVEALNEFADVLNELADRVPEDLKADAELLAAGTRVLAEIDPETGPTEEQQAIFVDTDYDAAGTRIDAYLDETCSVRIGE